MVKLQCQSRIRQFLIVVGLLLFLRVAVAPTSAHGPDDPDGAHYTSPERDAFVQNGERDALLAYDLAALLPDFQLASLTRHGNEFSVALNTPRKTMDESTASALLYVVDSALGTASDTNPAPTIYTISVNDRALSDWLPATTESTAAPAVAPAPAASNVPQGRLSGRIIVVSPGHGRYWTGTTWALQRGEYWGAVEDYLTHDMALRLKGYLEAQGATVWLARDPDRNVGNGETGLPRWQEASRYYLKTLLGSHQSAIWDACGTDLQDDICARPYYANWRNADLLISIHSNGGGGTGTETWYDTDNGYQNVSLALANAVQTNTLARIRSNSQWSGWVSRGVKGSNGGYGENRRATRPAIIIETAFHDRQTPDNAALQNPAFQKSVALGICDGVLAYFGQSSTCDLPPYAYFDDFSDSASGWTVATTADYRARYRSGTYEITNDLANSTPYFLLPQVADFNYTAQAEMRLHSGSPVRYGLVFDWQNANNYYVFSVNPTTQSYSLVQLQNGTTTTLVNSTSTAIAAETATNLLKVVRRNNTIELSVNGQLLTTVNGGYTGNRTLGVYTKSGNDVPVTVRFDTYSVSEID